MSLGLMDRKDMEFLVRDVLKVDQLFKYPRFEEQSWEMFDITVDMAWKYAHDDVLPTMALADREGSSFDGENVKTPECFKALYKAYCEGGWLSIMLPEAKGGMGMPKSLAIQPLTLIAGANIPFFLLPGLGEGAADMIEEFGTEDQIKRFNGPLFSGRWGGTMCLTETEAGSDVGNLRTVARKQPDGSWHVEGNKIFITWGDHDLCENIVYPVLARIEGDPPGSKGVSIFLVNKYLVDGKGKVTEQNGVRCTSIEHKMGIHASPTCEIAFGENKPAIGELLGKPCQGMPIMFQMMNSARIMVGMQSVALAEGAYRYAHQYALDRNQGAALENFKDATAPRVPIAHHPDVRRMLLNMRSTVDGLRAMLTMAALQLDLSHVLEGSERDRANGLLALLTPLVKGYASEVGYVAAGEAVMVLGGHGYLSDHPIEQYVRDSMISRLYEGTTGIQAMDLVGRKLNLKGGMVLMDLLMRMDSAVKKARKADLGDLADYVASMRAATGITAMGLGKQFKKGDFHGPLLQATPMMMLVGDAVMSWLHLMMATAAVNVDKPTQFHKNKVLSARHFIAQAATRVAAVAQSVKQNDQSAMKFEFEGEND